MVTGGLKDRDDGFKNHRAIAGFGMEGRIAIGPYRIAVDQGPHGDLLDALLAASTSNEDGDAPFKLVGRWVRVAPRHIHTLKLAFLLTHVNCMDCAVSRPLKQKTRLKHEI